jgi:2-hydroxy-3-keto-5-methylthiopentenyl-1-phosphate phosphatase
MQNNLGRITTLSDWVNEWIEEIAIDNGITLEEALGWISRRDMETAMIDAGADYSTRRMLDRQNTKDTTKFTVTTEEEGNTP